MNASKEQFNRKILLAVDDSVNARRAVAYVGHFVGDRPGFEILLLHIIPDPEEDFFSKAEEMNQWISQYRKKLEKCLHQYRQILLDHGLKSEDVSVRIQQRSCPSLADCILSERETLGFKTIVVGRQGLSRREEFLFGSISRKIVTHAQHCTVWVVE